mmetsp:Transcript_43811/g.42297  ORF Transcript_43811/g.42297 Transcript_43811/m.42297 type:complete len:86 (+) Transcript_43811:1763-2020(+)
MDQTLDLNATAQKTGDISKFTDNRKVIIEDLIYIDDLEILIYTTIAPKTSTIFVSHTKKQEKSSSSEQQVEVINLSNIKKDKNVS